MEKIPQNCIEFFKELHTYFPSVIEIGLNIKQTDVINFFSKYRVVWRTEFVNDEGKIREVDKLIDYDPSGIMVYVYDGYRIFIMTTESRIDVAKLTINRLKKLTNGNNLGTTEE